MTLQSSDENPVAVQRSLASLRAQLDAGAGRLSALLFVETPPRLGTNLALARAMLDAGHLPLVVCTFEPNLSAAELCGFEDLPLAVLSKDDVRSLNGVDVFFSSESVRDVAPAGAATVGIVHSLPDAGLRQAGLMINYSGNVQRYPIMIRALDYLVIAVRQAPSDWTQENYGAIGGVYPPTFLEARRPMLDIVPGGYPKLDYSERILTAGPGKGSVLLYAPTSAGSSVSRVKTDAEAIFASLLGNFPDYTIVFRPYPTPNDLKFAQKAAERFLSGTRFVLDSSSTGIEFQKLAAVSVTDSSSGAITFSMATRRPLVRAKLMHPDSAGKPIPIPFSYYASSRMALVEAVQLACQEDRHWEARISEEREKTLYNPGTASAYLAKNLPLFAARESHPDWLSIERRPWIGGGDAAERDEHISYLRQWGQKWGKSAKAMQEEITAYLSRPKN